eukprot:CAMPEP_0172637462 /NCGR_PEP_ID=MMETSP1068-20121228/209131_1 /TAXON_ID=35684 /ORGANISM="Pseudopedinella elastica, Strain CCMP716" /LENGTH=112 /DNA_ID=CAMNT_0013450127 /DNA_START=176 /DNA_END=514 /DNA_ORIENTATION=+
MVINDGQTSADFTPRAGPGGSFGDLVDQEPKQRGGPDAAAPFALADVPRGAELDSLRGRALAPKHSPYVHTTAPFVVLGQDSEEVVAHRFCMHSRVNLGEGKVLVGQLDGVS